MDLQMCILLSTVQTYDHCQTFKMKFDNCIWQACGRAQFWNILALVYHLRMKASKTIQKVALFSENREGWTVPTEPNSHFAIHVFGHWVAGQQKSGFCLIVHFDIEKWVKYDIFLTKHLTDPFACQEVAYWATSQFLQSPKNPNLGFLAKIKSNLVQNN